MCSHSYQIPNYSGMGGGPQNRSGSVSEATQNAFVSPSVNTGNGSGLIQARGDVEDAESSISASTVYLLLVSWMAAGCIIYYVNASREETPEVGVFSCLCGLGCFPVGCLAMCLPLDSPDYAFSTARTGENRRLLGRGTTDAIVTQEYLYEMDWFRSFMGFVNTVLMIYSGYAGASGVMARATCPAGFVLSVLLALKAIFMLAMVSMRAIFSHHYKDAFDWSSGPWVYPRQDEVNLRSWLKKLLYVQKVFFLASLCCTSGFMVVLCCSRVEEGTHWEVEASPNSVALKKKEDVLCFESQMSVVCYFMAWWLVAIVLALLYWARQCCRGKASAAKDDLREMFLKQAHLAPF